MMGGPVPGRASLEVEVEGRTRQVTVEPLDDGRVAVGWDDTRHVLDVIRVGSGALSLLGTGEGADSIEVSGHETAPGELRLRLGGRLVRARVTDRRRRRGAVAAHVEGEHVVAAPMPGRVVRVLAAPGETVEAGQGLVVVEAMKMENAVAAPAGGVVAEIRVKEGDPVEAGGVLAVVRVAAEAHD